MNILYVTNGKAENIHELPNFMETFGDRVLVITQRFDLNYLKDNQINFIVCDRAQFLIKKEIIDYLPKKIINLHPSFLPWGRGYYPNYWSIKKSFPHGVTIHFIDEGIDSGDIIVQTRCGYKEEDTLKDTYERLRKLMIGLFKSCWEEIKQNKMESLPQDLKSGNIFFKKDFEKNKSDLENGWETQVKNLKKNI